MSKAEKRQAKYHQKKKKDNSPNGEHASCKCCSSIEQIELLKA